MSSINTPESGGSATGTNGRLIYNWISLLGIALAIVAMMTGLIVGFSDALLDLHIPYVGVFYVLLAGLAAAGISVVGVLQAQAEGAPIRPDRANYVSAQAFDEAS